MFYYYQMIENSVLISFDQTLSGVNKFHPEYNF